jgi:hypothetical protein
LCGLQATRQLAHHCPCTMHHCCTTAAHGWVAAQIQLYWLNCCRCQKPLMSMGRFWPNSDVAQLHYLISCEPQRTGLMFHFANADHKVGLGEHTMFVITKFAVPTFSR